MSSSQTYALGQTLANIALPTGWTIRSEGWSAERIHEHYVTTMRHAHAELIAYAQSMVDAAARFVTTNPGYAHELIADGRAALADANTLIARTATG